MKKIFIFILLSIFYLSTLTSQQTTPKSGEQKIAEDENPPGDYVYNPSGRRDPFIDLLVGEKREKTSGVSGEQALLIGELELVGIACDEAGQCWATLTGPDGMPYFLKKGDRLFDGYVLSIDSNKVVLRRELRRPGLLRNYEDIVKKLSPEEEGK